MELFHIFIIIAQIVVSTKSSHRKHKTLSSSEESIENLLYYKDSNHKTEAPPTTTTECSTPNPCPCQRLCCTVSCECDNNSPSSVIARHMQPRQDNGMPGPLSMDSPPIMPVSDPRSIIPLQPQIGRNRPLRSRFNPSFGARRGGISKQDIKSLISKDEDIKKIIKDLVSVTKMKAVVDIGKEQQSVVAAPPSIPVPVKKTQ